ncbi:hypothetical protein EMCRGX_G006444 [Ephydatia muelleri]
MSPRQSTLQGEESDPPPRAACHHDSPHCRVQRVTHPQDEPVTGSGRYRHSSMSPRQSTLQGEESDPPPRAACHHDSPHCRVQRVTHPQDEPVTGSGRYRHSSISPRQSTLQVPYKVCEDVSFSDAELNAAADVFTRGPVAVSKPAKKEDPIVLMFIKNSFQGVVPAMSLQDNHKKLIVATTEYFRGSKGVGCIHAQIRAILGS